MTNRENFRVAFDKARMPGVQLLDLPGGNSLQLVPEKFPTEPPGVVFEFDDSGKLVNVTATVGVADGT